MQAKAALRQLMGYDTVTEDFDVTGDLAYVKSRGHARRPQARGAGGTARSAGRAAAASSSRRTRRRSRVSAGRATSTGNAEYDRVGPANTLGIWRGDRSAVPRSQSGQHRAQPDRGASGVRAESAARATVLTDVTNAYAALQTNDKIVALYQSGYLDQAQQSLDITTYVYQQGAGSLLDVLDAERTYRDHTAGVSPGAGGAT